MKTADEVRDAIKDAERKIDAVIGELEEQGITVVDINRHEINPIGTDLRTTAGPDAFPDLNNEEATYEEWKNELQLQIAYFNITLQLPFTEEEMLAAYDDAKRPSEAIVAQAMNR